uniref:RING-type domain-containing protein n=1 Tax=Attheya septentrionalis TaxID=420275 RepID=A0A7S2UIA0_9STRA|mmetsp:Transcript_24756/g.44844  ORF Transcript_24756/g.44844 Transcript_24756/m.44844 type:complete len:349 (+) Transcript_24756:268-1314(+)
MTKRLGILFISCVSTFRSGVQAKPLPNARQTSFRYYCRLSSQPVENLFINPNTGEISLSTNDRNLRRNEESSGNHLLHQDEIEMPGGGLEWTSDALQVTPGSPEKRDLLFEEVIQPARLCRCANDPGTYCAVNNMRANVCGVASSYRPDEPAGCFHFSEEMNLVRNIFPLLVVWYLALFAFFLFAKCGSGGRMYVLGSCFPMSVDRAAQRVLNHEINIRNRIRRQLTEEQRQEDLRNGFPNGRRVPLILKTKIFEASNVKTVANKEHPGATVQNEPAMLDLNDTEEELMCVICFGEIKDGDRVGDLPTCSHSFHVECLKSWIRRRNVCPLCQSAQIASPMRRSRQTDL